MPVHYFYFILVLITFAPNKGVTEVQYKTEFWNSKFKCEVRLRETTLAVLNVIKRNQKLSSAGSCKQVRIQGLEI